MAFSLVDKILYFRWNYFFGSKLSPTTAMSATIHLDSFYSLFKVLIQSYKSGDTDIVRQNIIAINNLNSQWKLFENEYFKRSLFADFFVILLRALQSESEGALQEDLQFQLQILILADSDLVKERIVPEFLNTLHISTDQKNILHRQFYSLYHGEETSEVLHSIICDLNFFESLG